MTKEREALKLALEAYIKAGYGNSTDFHLQSVAYEQALQALSQPEEDFCYCNDSISLQIVSGGAAVGGLYYRVKLKIDGEYVDYVRAQPEQEPTRHCRSCGGTGERHTGVDESPTTICKPCDGTGQIKEKNNVEV